MSRNGKDEFPCTFIVGERDALHPNIFYRFRDVGLYLLLWREHKKNEKETPSKDQHRHLSNAED